MNFSFMTSAIHLLAANNRQKLLGNMRSCALKKSANWAIMDTQAISLSKVECKIAHASNAAEVAQEAATTFPNGTFFMSPFQIACALDPVVLECPAQEDDENVE
jgi:hypothetical protein